MAAISADLKEVLTAMELTVLPEDFVLVHLPENIKAIPGEWFRRATTRFAVVVQEPKTVTMILPRRKWLRMQNIFDKYESNGPWKVLGFKTKRPPVTIGLLAAVEAALRGAKIQIIPVSTLRRFHVLVPKSDLPRAVRALRDLMEHCGKKKAGPGPRA